MAHYAISRRKLLRLAALLPVGAVVAACSSGSEEPSPPAVLEPETAGNAPPPESTAEVIVETATPSPEPTSTPVPFVVAAGEQQFMLMAGTPYETPYYVYGTGTLGPILTVLGGVHGNEPGGWLAAERLVEQVRPEVGALLVVPRANRQAIDLFARTTDELGDLNRLYPGNPNGLPMAVMAYEIIETLRRFHATHVIDMHESWSFYRDRSETATGTAYLGQTVSARGEPGESLGRQIVDAVNATKVRLAHEEFTFREWPPRDMVPGTPIVGDTNSGTPIAGFTGYRGSSSSLGLPAHIPGLAAILVEMGQQQDLERRIQLHVDMVSEALGALATTT